METFHELTSNLLRPFLPIDIVHLLRVSLQIIEFPCVYVIVEMDEFVALSTDSIMTLHHVFCWVFIEMIIDGIAPFLGSLLLAQQREQTLALQVLGNRRTSQIKERRGIINVLDHLVHHTPPFQPLWQTHEERSVETFLVHEALVEPSMLAHIKTLVAGVDEERFVEQASLTQVIHQAPHIVIEAPGDLSVITHIALELVLDQILALKMATLEIAGQAIVESP